MARAVAAQQQLTALEHLHELWLRIVSSVVMAFIGGGAAYFFRAEIINFLQRPLHQTLYYTSPMGSFQFIMQVCLLVGIILALPMLIYNVLRFIEPAFNRRFSRFLLLSVLLSSLILAALGVAFGYYLTLPFALQFFNSVGTSALHPLISVNEYFSFILGYLATFAVVFQLPLLLLFINHIKPFTPGGLSKWRGKLYIGAFAVSLIMPSSPDPLSQISLAIPIIVLYEFSLFILWNVNRKHRRKPEVSEAVEMHSPPTPKLEPIHEFVPAEIKDIPIPEVEEEAPVIVVTDTPVEPQPVQPAATAKSRAPTIDGFYRGDRSSNSTAIDDSTKDSMPRRDYQQPLERRNYMGGPASRPRLISDIL